MALLLATEGMLRTVEAARAKARLESKLDQAARLTRKVANELSQTLYSAS